MKYVVHTCEQIHANFEVDAETPHEAVSKSLALKSTNANIESVEQVVDEDGPDETPFWAFIGFCESCEQALFDSDEIASDEDGVRLCLPCWVSCNSEANNDPT